MRRICSTPYLVLCRAKTSSAARMGRRRSKSSIRCLFSVQRLLRCPCGPQLLQITGPNHRKICCSRHYCYAALRVSWHHDSCSYKKTVMPHEQHQMQKSTPTGRYKVTSARHPELLPLLTEHFKDAMSKLPLFRREFVRVHSEDGLSVGRLHLRRLHDSAKLHRRPA